MAELDPVAEVPSAPGKAPSRPAARVRKRKPSIFRDRVVRRMVLIAAGLVVLYLITVVAALLMGVIGGEEPRTLVEHNLMVTERLAMQSPSDPAAWANYIRALMADGQYAKAQDVIDKASAVVDQSASQDLLAAQADLYFERKRYDDCIATVDDLRAKLKAYYEAKLKDPESDEAKGLAIHINYWESLIVKAEALVETGDVDGAIAALDEYIEERPTAADVLVRRGDLKARAGDKAGAEADYRAALKYLPTDEDALQGLQEIGAE